MERGLIHIYCGDGKGKTSSAVGLAVRAAGCKKKVLFARFLKNENSGELKVLDAVLRRQRQMCIRDSLRSAR